MYQAGYACVRCIKFHHIAWNPSSQYGTEMFQNLLCREALASRLIVGWSSTWTWYRGETHEHYHSRRALIKKCAHIMLKDKTLPTVSHRLEIWVRPQTDSLLGPQHVLGAHPLVELCLCEVAELEGRGFQGGALLVGRLGDVGSLGREGKNVQINIGNSEYGWKH